MKNGLPLFSLISGLLAGSLHAGEASIGALKTVSGAMGARAAVRELVAGGRENLLPVLHGFQGATPLGSNWLRSAFETIAAAEVRAGRSLPADELTAFIRDTANAPAARRLAYEWLLKQDDTLSQRLIPGLLQDPHPDFRRDAVARLISLAADADGERAVELYREALLGAVHEDQVKTVAKVLNAAGDSVDLQRHFGFLANWQIVGPFDNRDKKGFAIQYPPELGVDPEASYDGQLLSDEVHWQAISTEDDFGVIDIGGQIENYKGSLMYATTTFASPVSRDVELRLGTPNAWKLWLNGELIFEREEYHRGTRMDQYRIRVSLRSGENTIVLKICQNEQEQDWAQAYQYQLRVSDSTGAAVLPAGESSE